MSQPAIPKNLNKLSQELKANLHIAVIGGGPVGITLCNELVKNGFKPELYEAGLINKESELLGRKDYDFESTSAIPEGVHQVGGGGNYWYGRVSQIPDENFDSHTSEWPFQKKEILNYYLKMFSLVGVPPIDDSDYLAKHYSDVAKIFPEEIKFSLYRYCDSNFANQLLASLVCNENFQLFTEHYCINMKYSNNKVICDFLIKNKKQSKKQFDIVILSAGTIQTTSLILKSLETLNPIPNSKKIGKNLMEHYETNVGTLRVSKSFTGFKDLVTDVDGSINFRDLFGVKHGLGLKLNFESRSLDRFRLCDFHLELRPFQRSHIFHWYNNLLSKNSILRRIIYKIERIYWSFYDKFLVICKSLGLFDKYTKYTLYMKGEEIKTSKSFLRLSKDKSKIVYHHKVSWQSSRIIRKSLKKFGQIMSRLEPVKIRFYTNKMFPLLKFKSAANWHPMGTTPFGTDPNKVICNSDLSLINNEKIFVASASVFPSGSYQNPTSTVLALGIRLVDHLSKTYDNKLISEIK